MLLNQRIYVPEMQQSLINRQIAALGLQPRDYADSKHET